MDQNEFVLITTPFKDKIFRLAKRLLVSTEEAEDATQEVLFKLWSKSSSVSTYKNVEAFAMTLTKNYCLDQLKSKRATNVPLNSDHDKDFDSELGKNIEDLDSLNWVEKCISQLPEQQQIIIQLRDIEQYEYEEIAKIVAVSENTIRVTLSRARKTIREFMKNVHDYGIK